MSDRLPAADARWIAAARKLLPRWWRSCRRDMPWRRTADPYAIWVSEVMLQQTQVATVRSYYRRFLKRFPTIGALARAPLEAVLKVWQGLGYYGRARNMHAAAAVVSQQFGGRLPRTAAELRRLPGVGRYTAAAVASIAFGADEAVLDGNVIRVLARGFAVRGDVGKSATQRRLWALASALVPPGRAGLFNQAMMDLGATVCTPRRPQCGSCPLRTICRAHRMGKEEDFPRKAPRRPVPHVDMGTAVTWRGGRVLIARRKARGLLGGLWEFPGGTVAAGQTPGRAARRAMAEQLGIRIRLTEPLATIHHAYSHFRLTLHVFGGRYVAGRCRAIGCEAFRWVRPAELDDYPFSVAHLKILTALRGTVAGGRAKSYRGKNV